MVRKAVVQEMRTVASYSDQRVADKIGVSRMTVMTARHNIENELFTYLGKDIIDYQLKSTMRSIARLEKNWDDLEQQKKKKNSHVVKLQYTDDRGRPFSYVDIKHTPITPLQMAKIVKQQTIIEMQIKKLQRELRKIPQIPHPATDESPLDC